MNFFKNILAITLLLTINHEHAKQVGSQPQVRPQQPSSAKSGVYPEHVEGKGKQPKPTVQPQVQPKITIKTFQQFVAEIKSMPAYSVWNNTHKILQQSFVNTLIEDAIVAHLGRTQLNILLIIARDTHAQFTGDTKTDITILKNLEIQRDNATSRL